MSLQLSIASQVLESWGTTVTALPTSTSEESDWLAVLDDCRLLVEEKAKFDNPVAQAARDSALATGRVHGTTIPLTHNNTISSIVRKASSQLSSSGGHVDHDLRIMWFTGVGADAEAQHLQFMATLYGSTRIFELDRPLMKDCYFFRNSDFFRFRDQLDGAIVAFLRGDVVTFKLCLNPYSPHWERLRDSPFAKPFPNGAIDPIAEEACGKAYVADTDIPRSDEAAVLRYLEQKYGLERAMTMEMNFASATVLMPR